MKNPLTEQHRQQLKQACSLLDEARGLCKRCKNCNIDTTEQDKVIEEIDQTARALLQNFFPPLGNAQELQ